MGSLISENLQIGSEVFDVTFQYFSIGIMDHELNISQTWSMIWLMNDMNDMTGQLMVNDCYISHLLSMNDMTDMTWIVNDCNNHHNHSF